MIQKLGYDIQFEIPAPVTMVALLNVRLRIAARYRVSGTNKPSGPLPIDSVA